jgi:hypothetical protein
MTDTPNDIVVAAAGYNVFFASEPQQNVGDFLPLRMTFRE